MNITIKSPLGEQTFDMADKLAMDIIYRAYRYAIGQAGCDAVSDEDLPQQVTPTTPKELHDAMSLPLASSRGRSRVESLFGDKKHWKTGEAVSGPQNGADGEQPAEEYKGFLLIECEACGKLRGFCAKQPITAHRCTCGHETPLRSLRPAFVKCKCGREFKYKTNITGQRFTYNCLECGSPVDMELNGKGTAYVAIGASRGGGVLIFALAPIHSRRIIPIVISERRGAPGE